MLTFFIVCMHSNTTPHRAYRPCGAASHNDPKNWNYMFAHSLISDTLTCTRYGLKVATQLKGDPCIVFCFADSPRLFPLEFDHIYLQGGKTSCNQTWDFVLSICFINFKLIMKKKINWRKIKNAVSSTLGSWKCARYTVTWFTILIPRLNSIHMIVHFRYLPNSILINFPFSSLCPYIACWIESIEFHIHAWCIHRHWIKAAVCWLRDV